MYASPLTNIFEVKYRVVEHMLNCPAKVPISENVGAIKQAVSQVSTPGTNARLSVCPIFLFYDYEKSCDSLDLDYIPVS